MNFNYITMMRLLQRFVRTRTALIIIFLPVMISCESFVEVSPSKTELSSVDVFESDLTATAAVASIYVDISASAGARTSVTTLAAFASDELVPYIMDANYQQVFENTISSRNVQITGLWADAYFSIYKANAILEGLSGSSKITAATKQRLEGETRFLRAFINFYLVNLFGDVPLITTTNYSVNSLASRAPETEVYDAIVEDLLLAKALLASDFSASLGERVKPTRWTASALLSRVYLYRKEWAKAEAEATLMISNDALFSLVPLDEVFLKNNNESIWQVLPVRENINTETGANFVLVSEPNFAALSDDFANSFEVGDSRKISWVGHYDNGASNWNFPFKYKIWEGSDPLLEYEVIFRLAEQYLIRAEARAHQDNFSGSVEDINVIRARAELPLLDAGNTVYDQPSILLRIEGERKAELFCEWGHRWCDLKRTGRADAVLGPLKTEWEGTDVLFPIPQSEVLINKNLRQNPGY